MKQKGQRIEKPCPTCLHSSRKGLLWLSGNDYLVCTDCNGTGNFVVYEQIIIPGKSFRVDGFKSEPNSTLLVHQPESVLLPGRDIAKEIEREAR